MTILAETPAYLAEYDRAGSNSQLTIACKVTGLAKTIHGPRIASDFRDCLKTHSAERTIEVWLKIMRNQPWEPVYKFGVLAMKDLGLWP